MLQIKKNRHYEYKKKIETLQHFGLNNVVSKHTCLFWFVLIVCTTLLGFHLMIKRIIILYLLEIIEKRIFPTIFILDKHKNIFLQIIMDDIK